MEKNVCEGQKTEGFLFSGYEEFIFYLGTVAQMFNPSTQIFGFEVSLDYTVNSSTPRAI